MPSNRSVGRAVGVMLLAQAVAAPVSNFALLRDMGAPGYLETAAGRAPQIRLAVLLLIAVSALSVAVAVIAWPTFRRRAEGLAVALLVLSGVGLALQTVEGAALLSMLSLSERYAQRGPGAEADAAYVALAWSVAAARRWAHYTNLLVGGVRVLLFVAVLHRAALVPRVLTLAALATGALQVVAVTMPILGRAMNFTLLAPFGVVFLALTLWLLARGFAGDGPGRPTAPSAAG